MTDDSSFEELPITQRQENLDYLSKWLQNQKLAIANTELFSTQVFDQLHNFCQKNAIDVPEFDETKQLITTFYTKAQRIQMKLKKKALSRQIVSQVEDEEMEKNREILKEVKVKLALFIKLDIPLPFIINYIRLPRIQEKYYKLTLIVNDSLLDCINWYLRYIDEKKQISDGQEFKMKELLTQQLEIISKQRQMLKRELSEVFLKLKRQLWFKQLEKLYQSPHQLNKQTQISSKILLNLAQFCEGIETTNIQITQGKTNGIYNFTKILLSICWYEQIPLPDILMHSRMTGRLEKLKEEKDHSNIIRLRQRITFLRQIYKIPQVYQKCLKHKLIPIELNTFIPQYLQEQYDDLMTKKRIELCPIKDDYFIESQMRLLIREFSTLKNKLKQIFRDLRFQQGKQELFELYADWINSYDGDLEKIKCLQSIRQQKDIQIVCMIKHLEMMLQNDLKVFEPPIKFDYILHTAKNFQFQCSTYDKIYSISTRNYFIKLFLLDSIALGQPFPYIFDFYSYEDGKFQQSNFTTMMLGQFFYCPQVRTHFSKKYCYNIQLVEKDNKVIYTYIPAVHQDFTKLASTIPWDDILLEHLKLIVATKYYLVEEITYVVNSLKFQTIKQQISQDKQYVKEYSLLITEIDKFYNQKVKELKNR